MEILPIKTRALRAPKDDLLDAIFSSKMKLREGDIVALSSKVVAIHEGATLLAKGVDKRSLVKKHTDWYLEVPSNIHRTIFTLNKGAIVGSAGIDESNGNDHFILYPQNPFESARTIRKALLKQYGIKKLGLIITDSMSVPLRRGAIGFALSWDGFQPLNDYRKKKDLFGRPFKMELANVVDGLSAGAVSVMGEGSESTPLVVIRGANVTFGNRKQKDSLIVEPADDIFAPLFFTGRRWKKGAQG
jgi:coenzyme F420-0:L-glutamate ligase